MCESDCDGAAIVEIIFGAYEANRKPSLARIADLIIYTICGEGSLVYCE